MRLSLCCCCLVPCLLIQVLGGGAFLVAMLRPFLRHISKESRRCAELLVQLPPDFDVEGMVAATWSAVKQVCASLHCRHNVWWQTMWLELSTT